MLPNPLLSVILPILVSCAAESQAPDAVGRDVTVLQLLRKPLQFDGKRVSVVGYYYVAYEDSFLFTTRAAAKRKQTERCIWVEFPAGADLTSIADRMSRIVGTFHYIPSRRRQEKGAEEWTHVWPYLIEDVRSFRPVR